MQNFMITPLNFWTFKKKKLLCPIFIYAYYILTKYKPQLYLLLAEKADLSKLTYYTQYQQWIEGKLTI